ncbi:MAG TPA: VanZ family protein, partial [Thermodesulfobacteriota bacterium]|nr:VanZ family protein [Thermodesulfobacteriota bacterium]
MRYYFFILLYMTLIAVGSLMPVGIPHHVIRHQDKYIHILLYLPLGFLLSFPRMPSSYGLIYIVPLLIGALYGAAMELLQSLLPYRDASLGDAGANCL